MLESAHFPGNVHGSIYDLNLSNVAHRFPIQRQDVVANWEEIVRQNAATVVNAALRVVGNPDDAEDIAQEVFVEAFRRWQANHAHHWGGLLRRMAVCRAVDFLRKQKLNETIDDSHDVSVVAEPSQIAMARELETRLRQALTQLTPREAEVFCLHYFERQPQAAIAETLAIQPGAVATALHKARTRLETELKLNRAKETH